MLVYEPIPVSVLSRVWLASGLDWTPRQQQQLSFITECTDDIKHVPGLSNMVTYCLSRPLVAPVCQVAAHQQPTTPMYQVAPHHLEAGPDAPVTPLVIDYAAIAPTK